MLRVGTQPQGLPQDGGFQEPDMSQMGGNMGPQPQDMPADPMMGGNPMPQDMPQDGQQSQFDTNFDAGVEADEDTDPKKYIQQLTGKLSTTLNSYNSENADDEGLNKYVAKMIVKASTKNMDDAQKKEIIKAINTSSTDAPEDEEPEGTEEVDVDVENNKEPQGGMPMEPMQEGNSYKKKDLRILAEKIRKKAK